MTVLHCPACDVRYRVESFKAESRYHCRKCRGLLQPVDLRTKQTVAPGAASAPGAAGAMPVRIGHYEVIRELGRGGMGIVYLARQEGLERRVAIKILPPGPAVGEETRHRFQREARACGKLKHPNIVAVHEVGEEGGTSYFVMDFIDGIPLDRRLKGGPVLPKKAAEWTMGIAGALAYAHAHGVIHRDLKPANVILEAGERPCLMDFGLAKDTTTQSLLSHSGDVFGTPAYMSPEQASGRIAQVDAVSDVYALGVMLYEMATGSLPFVGANLSETIYKVIHEEPPAPRTLRPRLSPDLEAVCLKAMDKDRARRYASAEAMAKDLAQYLAGEAVDATPVTRLSSLMRHARRHRSKAAIAAGAAAAGALVFAAAYAMLFREKELDRIARELADPLPQVRASAARRLEAELREGRFEGAEVDRAFGLIPTAVADADPALSLAAVRAAAGLCEQPGVVTRLSGSKPLRDALVARFAHADLDLAEASMGLAARVRFDGIFEGLERSLHAPSRRLRVAAIRALGMLGRQGAIQPLMRTAQRDRTLAVEVEKAIQAIYGRGEVHSAFRKVRGSLESLIKSTSRHDAEFEAILAEEEGRLADPVLQAVADLRDAARPEAERSKIAYDLSQCRDYPDQDRLLNGLLDCLDVEPEEVALDAAWAAEALSSEEKVQAVLLGRLDKGESVQRARAALALARPDRPRTAEAIMLELERNTEPGIAEALCRALGRTGERSAVPYLVRAARRRDGAVREAAVRALKAVTGRDLGGDPEAYAAVE